MRQRTLKLFKREPKRDLLERTALVDPDAPYYVYALAYPDGKVFYIGKGKDNRMYEHRRKARRQNCDCTKCQLIQGIENRGGAIIEYVIQSGLIEPAAFSLEEQLIKTYCRQLVNVQHAYRRPRNRHLLYIAGYENRRLDERLNPNLEVEIVPPLTLEQRQDRACNMIRWLTSEAKGARMQGRFHRLQTIFDTIDALQFWAHDYTQACFDDLVTE